MPRPLVVLAVAVLAGSPARASECCTKCPLRGYRSDALKKALAAGVVPAIEEGACASGLKAASSVRAPEGKPPPVGKGKDAPVAGMGEDAYDAWTCQYSPQKLTDNDPATAWVEGVDGNGVGEVVLVRLVPGTPAFIWAGLGASDALHKANGRPKAVQLHFLRATDFEQTQCSTVHRNLKVEASTTGDLEDVNGFQLLPILPFGEAAEDEGGDGDMRPGDGTGPMGAGPGLFLALEILSTYPGKVKDTCISEIVFSNVLGVADQACPPEPQAAEPTAARRQLTKRADCLKSRATPRVGDPGRFLRVAEDACVAADLLGRSDPTSGDIRAPDDASEIARLQCLIRWRKEAVMRPADLSEEKQVVQMHRPEGQRRRAAFEKLVMTARANPKLGLLNRSLEVAAKAPALLAHDRCGSEREGWTTCSDDWMTYVYWIMALPPP